VNGRIVKTKIATYFPLLLVGAISEVAAKAVNSLTPAPAPAIAIPAIQIPLATETTVSYWSAEWAAEEYQPIKLFIVLAVLETIMPMQTSEAPMMAT
jgi:hypothetical protein